MAADRGKVLGVIVAVLAGLAALAWAAGGLWFAKHEADTLHLIDLVLRRAAVGVPHVDYMTPLGMLAIEPFAALMRAGLNLGNALIWGQILVAALLAPGAWWVAVSRLRGAVAAGFVLAVLLLAGGLVPGGTDPKLSLSMHYNRWAWAVAFLPLTIAVLPGRRAAPVADGIVTGLAMAVLGLLKATVFAAFLPAVVAGLALARAWRTLAVALAAGLAVCAGVTLAFGPGFWPAYLGDLIAVAGSEVRAAPVGAGLAKVIYWPAHVGATGLAMASLILLRRQPGLGPVTGALALMLAGAVYATYQNYGNDPLWLILWAVVLLTLDMAGAWRRLAAAVALALVFPVAANIAVSPLRQLLQPSAAYEPLFPEDRARGGVMGVTRRFSDETVRRSPGPDGRCTLVGGLVAVLRRQAAALSAADIAGRQVFVADVFGNQWMFGDAEPLPGGAPWYYGGLPGIAAANVVLVPKCPADPGVSDAIMAEIAARGIGLTTVLETDAMTVFGIER